MIPSLLLGIYMKELKSGSQKDISSSMSQH